MCGSFPVSKEQLEAPAITPLPLSTKIARMLEYCCRPCAVAFTSCSATSSITKHELCLHPAVRLWTLECLYS